MLKLISAIFVSKTNGKLVVILLNETGSITVCISAISFFNERFNKSISEICFWTMLTSGFLIKISFNSNGSIWYWMFECKLVTTLDNEIGSIEILASDVLTNALVNEASNRLISAISFSIFTAKEVLILSNKIGAILLWISISLFNLIFCNLTSEICFWTTWRSLLLIEISLTSIGFVWYS